MRVKRLFDLFASALGLVVLSPLLLAISLGIYISDGRPILFLQTRAGRKGKPFKLIKFRTMKPLTVRESEMIAEGLTEDKPQDENDERIFPFGRFLRRTSLDELPQLVNVLKGDMSLVGPRPTLLTQAEAYDGRERRRLDVTPGITGLAQVKGRNLIDWDERIRLDLEYIEKRSFWLDVKILCQTLLQAVTGKGIYAREKGQGDE